MWSRRAFLQNTGVLGATALTARVNGVEAIARAAQSVAGRTPEDVASDETFWREIQFSFTLDRALTNLNNGDSSPGPRVVHEALKRYLDFSNQLPFYYRGQLARNLETVRRRLADEVGCDAEELALTRNASEGLQIVQNGLDLQPGDEVLTTDQDHARMLATWDQRVRCEDITLTKIPFPVPTTQDDLYERFERAITPRTRVLHFCHITNLTGQLFPVQRLGRLARERGLVSICDGAQAVAHFPFKLRNLECDYYGTSLQKWLGRTARHRFPVRPARTHRKDLAATGRAANPRQRHPEVRADWHPLGGADGSGRRGAGISPGDRHRAQGSAVPLLDDALGGPPQGPPTHHDPLVARARADLGVGHCPDRGGGHPGDQLLPVGSIPDRPSADRSRRLRRTTRDTQYLHTAGGDRSVRRRDA